MVRARGFARFLQQFGLGRRYSSRHPLLRIVLCATLLALIASPARTQTLQVVPSLSFAETYTDNIALAPASLQQADWVTLVVPGIYINSPGKRVRFNANYAPQIVHYGDKDRSGQVFQRGNVDGSVELAQQLLFVDAGAAVDQVNVSLQGPITINNINTTGNRSSTRTTYVSPHAQHDFGTTTSAGVRFTYSTWQADNQTIVSNSESNRVDFRVANTPGDKPFTWGMFYVREIINYESQPDTLSEAALAKARRLVSSTLGLTVQAGYERYESGIPGTELADPSWSVGADWNPSSRTKLAFAAGRRFKANAFNLEVRHRTRLTSWAAGYGEDVTTTRSLFFNADTTNTAGALDQLLASQYPDPVERQNVVKEFLARGLPPYLNTPINFFSNQLFMRKQWRATAGLLGARNILIASVFGETRELLFGDEGPPPTGDFGTSSSIRLAGSSIAWGWRITPRNTFNTGAGHSRNYFLDVGREIDFTYVVAGVTRQLQPKLTGSVFYRRQQNRSTLDTTTYVENAAIAALQMTF